MKEIDSIVDNIKQGFIDPFEDNSLTNFVLGPSKRIRSRVILLYLKASKANISPNLYKLLAAGEIIHNASLLHDDIIDESETRRGIPTIEKIYNSKLAILAGDYLLSFAIEKLLEINNREITKIFQNCTKKISEAEFKQFFNRGKTPDLDTYLEICKGKTAELFIAMFQSAALLSGISQEHARKFGEAFGIYFQIKNDLEETSSLNDKKNGVFTAIDILGIEKTQDLLDNYREEMTNLLGIFPDSKNRQELEDLYR